MICDIVSLVVLAVYVVVGIAVAARVYAFVKHG